MLNKTALITGATAGIGKATAILLAKNGFNIIATGRRTERLNDLQNIIETETDAAFYKLVFDVRDRDEVNKAFSQLPKDWQKIDLLVNNAGLAAGLDFIHEGNVDDWDIMIDTNVKGLLYVTKNVVPGMVSRQSGQIINIGSIAGKEVYPKGNVYCSTKFAVEALTKGMRIDLVEHNIKVSSICPGAVETEFSNVRFKGDEDKAKSVYQGFTPLFADDIAEAILFAVTRPAHVNINDMLIMANAQANSTITHRKN